MQNISAGQISVEGGADVNKGHMVYFHDFKHNPLDIHWSFKSYKIIQILRLILKDLGWLWLIQGCTQLFLPEKRILDL